jgi:hypothetical protein
MPAIDGSLAACRQQIGTFDPLQCKQVPDCASPTALVTDATRPGSAVHQSRPPAAESRNAVIRKRRVAAIFRGAPRHMTTDTVTPARLGVRIKRTASLRRIMGALSANSCCTMAPKAAHENRLSDLPVAGANYPRLQLVLHERIRLITPGAP